MILVGEPAGLPLLQFTLMMLWKAAHPQPHQLSRPTRALGGGRLALKRSADKVFDEFITPKGRRTARRIFMKLVKPGRGGRGDATAGTRWKSSTAAARAPGAGRP